MCWDRDIFSQDSLTESQLVAVVKASTPAVPAVSPREPGTSQAVEPSPTLSWYQDFVEESPLVEQLCSEVQEEELAADRCLPLPAGSVQVLNDSMEKVEQCSCHYELVDKVQTILL